MRIQAWIRKLREVVIYDNVFKCNILNKRGIYENDKYYKL